MGAVFPEERPAFYSMITGMVNELYAFRHHHKWWREVRMQAADWKRDLSPEENRSHDKLATDNESEAQVEVNAAPATR
jgi:hypothetical protein